MKKNMGRADGHARTILGVSLAAAVLGGFLQGLPAVIAGILAIWLLITALIKVCPVYRLFGVHSLPRK